MFQRSKASPIGLDIGRQAIKAVQVQRNAEELRLVECGKTVLPPTVTDESREEATVDAIRELTAEHRFRGRETVVCLGGDDLIVQNVRIPKTEESELDTVIRWEADERLPFDSAEAEIRSVVAGEVREADKTKYEVILLATRKAHVERMIRMLEAARLTPVAIDAYPGAVSRWFDHALRRKSDADRVCVYVDVGAKSTKVVVARSGQVVFVKDIAIGGALFDKAVAKKLQMETAEAYDVRNRLTSPSGQPGQRADDDTVSQAVADAIRPELETLGREVSMCVRYCSVTFRGLRPDVAFVFGGEARPLVVEALDGLLDVPVEAADPMRTLEGSVGRLSQETASECVVALGLSLR